VTQSRAWILTLSCEDRPKIVATVTNVLAALGSNIAESSQYWDRPSNRFFMRIVFVAPSSIDQEGLEKALAATVAEFAMAMTLRAQDVTPAMIVLVSKFDHCFEHLLYQVRSGWLKAKIAAVVSNHEWCRASAEAAGLAFHFWPVSKDNKAEQEKKILDLFGRSGAELVVLARYMQILSDDLSSRLFGRVINIHHSFLPSFKGAKPYHQAYDRGVKIIGATAHYVTPNLDEGPIIEQETERVTHALSIDELIAVGRDVESRVLSRAVKLHLDLRVLLNGRRTVVL